MTCLNCGSEAQGVYCYNCGQKTSTTRFSFLHIFKNDIASKYYSFFNSPIFFTIKELATRPGDSIREYILGKRVNHINYMSLFLLLSGIGIFLDKYTKLSIAEITSSDSNSKKMLENYFKFVSDNPKTFIAITIPLVSLFTYYLFKKNKYNFSEHLILHIYKASALLIISKIFNLFSILTTNLFFLKIISQIVEFGIFAYSFWFIYQFFCDKKVYSKVSLILRTFTSVVFGLIFSTLFMLIYWLVAFVLTNSYQ